MCVHRKSFITHRAEEAACSSAAVFIKEHVKAAKTRRSGWTGQHKQGQNNSQRCLFRMSPLFSREQRPGFYSHILFQCKNEKNSHSKVRSVCHTHRRRRTPCCLWISLLQVTWKQTHLNSVRVGASAFVGHNLHVVVREMKTLE